MYSQRHEQQSIKPVHIYYRDTSESSIFGAGIFPQAYITSSATSGGFRRKVSTLSSLSEKQRRAECFALAVFAKYMRNVYQLLKRYDTLLNCREDAVS